MAFCAVHMHIIMGIFNGYFYVCDLYIMIMCVCASMFFFFFLCNKLELRWSYLAYITKHSATHAQLSHFMGLDKSINL